MVWIKQKELNKLEEEFLRYIDFLKEKEMFSEYCRQIKKTPTYFYRIRNKINDRRESERLLNKNILERRKEYIKRNDYKRIEKITRT